MRLNKSGIESFNKQVVEIALNDPESYNKDKALEMIEFGQDDFDGMVWLTAKEARRIFRYCVTRTTAIDYDAEKDLLNRFHKKIEQAERKVNEQ